MAGSKSALLLCFLACLHLSARSVSDAHDSDFNILTLMWPGAKCNNLLRECCRPLAYEQPEPTFFVQTMRAYKYSTGVEVMINCSFPCRFSVHQLEDLMPHLNSYWPDVSCPSNSNEEQWRSTYCTYGTCSGLTEYKYFERALHLRSAADPLFVLQEYNIVPSSSKKYSLEDIENALLPSLGLSFYIECNRDYLWFFESQLYKIHICVSANAERFITCPFPRKSNCDAELRFVPFTDDMLHGFIANPISVTL